MPDVSHLPRALFECTTLRAFNRAFFALREIRIYMALLAAAAASAAWLADGVWNILIPAALVVLGYPSFEYAVHRWLLHNTHLCRTPLTARVWWRIHYRHHSAPRDQDVILAAPWTLFVAVSVGALLATSIYWNLAGLAAATVAALSCAILYEYFHSLEHARVELKHPYLLRMRQHHLTHHHLEDHGNFGIVTDVIDRLTGTALGAGDVQRRSPSVYNLGYHGSVRSQYPWIGQIERCVESGSPSASAPSGEVVPRASAQSDGRQGHP